MTALLETSRRTTRRAGGRRFKQVLLGFWAMYFSIVAVSNAINLLDVSGALRWHFLNSTNFEFMRSMVTVYGLGAGELLGLTIGTALVVALVPHEA